MNLRLLATPLVAATLLLSTLGCAKKEDATPAPVQKPTTGSYKLDGKTITCTTVAGGGYAFASGHTGLDYDFVNVTLTTVPEPADGPEILQLNYSRPSAGAAYVLYEVVG